MSFTTNRGNAQSERTLYIPVPRKTLYGGLLAGWWTYQKADKAGVMQDRLGMRLLVTHISGKTWEKLDDITEAVAFFSSSFYHNDKTGKESYLFTAMRALTGASPSQLLKISDSDILKTIDDAVGVGIAFMAEPGEDKATKAYTGNIAAGDTFEAADAKFSALAQAMAGKITIATTEGEDQRRYIKSPKAKELPEGMTAAEYLGIGAPGDDGEIPF
jgi:hypothetical protein